MSICHELARMINAYLDPALPRLMSPGGNLNSLRGRLENNVLTDHPRAVLCDEVRQAIRTEFFKVTFPSPPSPKLLQLATRVEILLTVHTSPNRPFFFPGARVTLPSERNPRQRQTGTTLQLRLKGCATTLEPQTTEALVHLDGPNGGAFRWISALELAPFPFPMQPAEGMEQGARREKATSLKQVRSTSAALASTSAKPPPAIPRLSGQASTLASSTRPLVPAAKGSASSRSIVRKVASQTEKHAAASAQSGANPGTPSAAGLTTGPQKLIIGQHLRVKSASTAERKPTSSQSIGQQVSQKQVHPVIPQSGGRPKRDESTRSGRQPAQLIVQDSLPVGFVPDVLRSSSPPPRKRLRHGCPALVSLASGSVLAASPESDKAALLGNQKPSSSGNAMVLKKRAFLIDSHAAAGNAISTSSGVSPSVTSAHGSVATLRPSPPPESSLGLAIPPEGSTHISDLRCPRPRAAVLDKLLVAERIVARRQNASSGNVVEYCVKWQNIGWDGCSWESRDALLQDVPGLVVDFDVRHPQPVSVARNVERVLSAAEQRAARRRDERRGTGIVAPSGIGAQNVRGSGPSANKNQRPSGEAVLIPTWFEAPIAELSFCGMVMHVRRDECSVFNDPMAAGRDLKKRRNRFKQEYPEAFERLFPQSNSWLSSGDRTDVKSFIDTNLKRRLEYGSRPIQFPRSLGSVLHTDVAHPVPKLDIEAAPPSWESYLMSLGLECKNWERDYLPEMPTADAEVTRTMAHAKRALDAESRIVGRERRSRMQRERRDRDMLDVGKEVNPGDVRIVDSCALSLPDVKVPQGMYSEEVMPFPHGVTGMTLAELDRATKAILGGSLTPEAVHAGNSSSASNVEVISGHQSSHQTELMLRKRNNIFQSAVASAGASGRTLARYYDPVWCCWRDLNASPTANKAS